MDTESTLTLGCVLGLAGIILPAVIKIGHHMGYEMPYLSALADFIARRETSVVSKK